MNPRPMKTLLLPALIAAAMLTTLDAAEERSITVTGEGRIKIRPDTVEIHGQLIGAAPIAADAMKKYEQHRERLVNSLKELKIEKLETEFGGTSIVSGSQGNQMMGMVQADNQPATPTNLTVSEPITIRLLDVAATPAAKLFEDVLKVVDAANDNGLQLAAPANRIMAMQFGEGLETTLATFLVRDEDKVRKLAVTAAMANAKLRGDDLAELAGAKRGAVKHVKESGLATAGDSETSQSLMMQIYGIEAPKPKARFSSPNFGQIEVVARLEVEFLLAP